MKFINSFDEINSYERENIFIATLSSNIKNKIELLNELYHKLQFPEYFGFNWDALWDLLCDFSWIKQKRHNNYT